jgi:hypothetical protein
MNNLYFRIATASIGIGLGLALGTNKEAKAVTFTITPDIQYLTIDDNNQNGFGRDGLGDSYYGSLYLSSLFVENLWNRETRATYEYDISNLSLPANTVIKHARFNAEIQPSSGITEYSYLSIFGYAGNGRPDASDFEAGVELLEVIPFITFRSENVSLSVDIAPFINQLLSNNESSFAGLSIRAFTRNFSVIGNIPGSYANLYPGLEITTEPVPEPTTIFGSVIGLCLGGWLKRKKSSRSNKTTPQH